MTQTTIEILLMILGGCAGIGFAVILCWIFDI
jgi:hypothetical protein